MIFTNFGALNQLDSLDRINMQIVKIDNSPKLKIISYDLGEFYKGKDGVIEIGKINDKYKRITIQSGEYANFQKTIIYIQKETPILVRKEITSKRTEYLTNGNIETTDLNYRTDFYVIDWQNEVYERITLKEYIPIEKTINKKEIEEFMNLISI